jgi:hypothetical protein
MSIVPTGRDNGLPEAASYVALVDVDPPVADHVLALLRDAGVTAVAEPLAGELGPYQDVRPPRRPTERVHVDRAQAQLARDLVGRALPTLRGDFHADAARRVDAAVMRAAEVEQAFAAIVAAYDQPTDPVGRWSALEDGEADRDPAAELRRPDDTEADEVTGAPGGDGAGQDPPRGSGLSSRLARRRWDDPPEDDPDPTYWPEDHFVPPVPAAGPRMDRIARFAWSGVIGGPLVLLLVVVLNLRVERAVLFAAVAAFIGGFITLVARMPDKTDDDDWDDGAVV